MEFDVNSITADWDASTISQSTGYELLRIIKLLIAKTKSGKIEWRAAGPEDRFILPCKKNECYECEIFGEKVRIEFGIMVYPQWSGHDVSFLLYITNQDNHSVFDSIVLGEVCDGKYDKFIKMIRLINACKITISESVNKNGLQLKSLKRAGEFRVLLEQGGNK